MVGGLFNRRESTMAADSRVRVFLLVSAPDRHASAINLSVVHRRHWAVHRPHCCGAARYPVRSINPRTWGTIIAVARRWRLYRVEFWGRSTRSIVRIWRWDPFRRPCTAQVCRGCLCCGATSIFAFQYTYCHTRHYCLTVPCETSTRLADSIDSCSVG
jgi:hypothetical protein